MLPLFSGPFSTDPFEGCLLLPLPKMFPIPFKYLSASGTIQVKCYGFLFLLNDDVTGCIAAMKHRWRRSVGAAAILGSKMFYNPFHVLRGEWGGFKTALPSSFISYCLQLVNTLICPSCFTTFLNCMPG